MLARELHERQVPSLFMTGRPAVARAAANAALGVIAKPYDPDHVDKSVLILESMIGGGDCPLAAHCRRRLNCFLAHSDLGPDIASVTSVLPMRRLSVLQ
jgi:hypothetical protein